jgi:hypothetical protein
VNTEHLKWFDGLKSLNKSDFPKRCACCGRIYQSEEEYFKETSSIRIEKPGIKATQDEVEGLFVELYRNCVCGSTLLAFFSDRRSQTDVGFRRRKLFDELVDYIVRTGVEPGMARIELLRVIHGEQSKMLEYWHENLLEEEKNGDVTTAKLPGQ